MAAFTAEYEVVAVLDTDDDISSNRIMRQPPITPYI